MPNKPNVPEPWDRKALPRVAFRTGLAGLVLLALASCDFDVTNPGPVQDQNLDDVGAHEPLVTGAMRGLLNGWSHFAHYGGAIARDHTTSGHVFAGGIPLEIELGRLSAVVTANPGWERTHQGRWIAEHAAPRMRQTVGAEADKYSFLGWIYLWGGFANRVLGEHVCAAVLDGGKPEPYTAHFSRAVELFTNAEKIGTATGESQLRLAAIAGRAAAQAYLGKWDEAVADAIKLPVSFKFGRSFTGRGAGDLGTDGERWRIIQSAYSTSYRSVSFWNTPFEKYFPATGDPRAAWGNDAKFKYAPVPRPTWGRFVDFFYPLKYYAPRNIDELKKFSVQTAAVDAIPINLATGREMVLIRAEAALTKKNWQEALTLINQVHTTTADPQTGKLGSYYTGKALEPVTATNETEAWAALKFERLLELVLEGRRFGDRKRWAASKIPGAIHPLEYLPDNHVQRYGVPKQPDLCFPVPQSEIDANSNIPTDFKDVKVSERG